ncbi:MAG: hypothetical protein PWP43_977 [Bacillota bacterium]|nr:hypothetical protein [Bacillota bacterium]
MACKKETARVVRSPQPVTVRPGFVAAKPVPKVPFTFRRTVYLVSL